MEFRGKTSWREISRIARDILKFGEGEDTGRRTAGQRRGSRDPEFSVKTEEPAFIG